MNLMNLMLAKTMVAAALVATAAAALAHGDTKHSRRAGPVEREQMAWGIAGNPRAGSRIVEFSMTDTMRFTPDTLDVRQGETIRIVVRNRGKLLHEYVLGTQAVLDEHAALMVKFPTMEHDEPYMLHVQPGKVGEIVWTFNRPGEFDFACLIAGHYQAGMVGMVKVAAAATSANRRLTKP